MLKDNIAKKQHKIDSISKSEPATRLNRLKVQKLEAEVRERNAIAKEEAKRVAFIEEQGKLKKQIESLGRQDWVDKRSFNTR
ncbi:MAG: hypothetical protein QNJ55_27350 [Xenococcus sp. MO_188.B8]|nr:hypothetical protein [Xenococcus sp. MO_188.B8]